MAADIVEMKAKGRKLTTIAVTERNRKQRERVKEICGIIETAFDGVQLGNGIGLWEARGMDDWKDEATCAACRLKDEKYDWSSIPAEQLRNCSSSPSFFDAEGMRFHLPAFLIAELRGQHGSGICFTLTSEDSAPTRFRLLSPGQRAAVRLFLQHIAEDQSYEFYRPDILRALERFWRE